MSSSEDEILVKKNKKIILDSDEEQEIKEEAESKADSKFATPKKSEQNNSECTPVKDEQKKVENHNNPSENTPNSSVMNTNSKKIKKPNSPSKPTITNQSPEKVISGGSNAKSNGGSNSWKGKSYGNKNLNTEKPIKSSSKPLVVPTKAKKPENSKEGKKDSNNRRKEIIVQEVLKRWWYVLPPWPPANFNYSDSLKVNGLRKVSSESFAKEPEENQSGLKKVQEVAGYPGCFRDSKGAFFDLRPKESCPSFDNFLKKSMDELLHLLVNALESQLKQLRSSDYMNDKLADKLQKMITRTNELVEAKKEEV